MEMFELILVAQQYFVSAVYLSSATWLTQCTILALHGAPWCCNNCYLKNTL